MSNPPAISPSLPIAKDETRARLMLVEDDQRLADLIRRFLEGNGYPVTIANVAAPVVPQVLGANPDLLILDLGLPGEDGLAICKQLRPSFPKPILILTARASDIDHVLGLELGADDYVIKPVEPRVLMARIEALLRRTQRAAPAESAWRFGRLVIDAFAHTVTLDGQSVALSNSEFELLMQLAMNAGKVQSRETLYRELYRREYDGADRMLDVRISHLRRKLGDDADQPLRIKTVWGQGYLFVPGAW